MCLEEKIVVFDLNINRRTTADGKTIPQFDRVDNERATIASCVVTLGLV